MNSTPANSTSAAPFFWLIAVNILLSASTELICQACAFPLKKSNSVPVLEMIMNLRCPAFNSSIKVWSAFPSRSLKSLMMLSRCSSISSRLLSGFSSMVESGKPRNCLMISTAIVVLPSPACPVRMTCLPVFCLNSLSSICTSGCVV